jgi:glycosyltransferase involved in cell wall biosynthesis
MSIKVSVIIPCYCVEPYIDRCVQSLIHQTIGLENLELIFINDASPDSTLDILLSYEKKYSESILVINSEVNLKQGGARNLGIQYASGDYIGFVDGDDWVELTMFEKLYKKAEEYNCDLAACRITRSYDDQPDKGFAGDIDSYIALSPKDNAENKLLPGFGGAIVTKIYRRSIILDNQVWFPENLAYEDNYWFPILHHYLTSGYMLEECLYHYYCNMNSTTTRRNSLHHLDRLTIETLKIEEYKKRGLFEQHYAEIEYQFIELYYINTLYILFTKFDSVPYDVFLTMKATVPSLFPNYASNPYLSNSSVKAYPILLQLIELDTTKDDLERIANIFRARQ